MDLVLIELYIGRSHNLSELSYDYDYVPNNFLEIRYNFGCVGEVVLWL